MRCSKCGGLMVSERFSDFFLNFYAWKCLNCGAVMDKTIMENKKRNPQVFAQYTQIRSHTR